MSLKEKVGETFKDVKHRVTHEVLEHGILFREYKKYHLRAAGEHLKKGAVIAPWCHLGSLDPFLAMKYLRLNFGDDLKRLIVPGSMKFMDGRLGSTATYMMHKTIEEYGVQVVPIIQHYDTTYSPEQKYEVNAASQEIMVAALQEPGTVVSLAPEGTRSRWGAMNEAQTGITKLLRKAQDAWVLPIGIAGTEDIMDINLNYNPFGVASFTYGCPDPASYLLRQSKEQGIHIKDFIMLRIAELIPPETRGYYGYPRFHQYYDNLITRNEFIPQQNPNIRRYEDWIPANPFKFVPAF